MQGGRRQLRHQGGIILHRDIVTIHVVLSQRSRGLVGLEDLARMKPTATSSTPRADRSSTRPRCCKPAAEEDRRRRNRRVLGRAAAGRSSVPQLDNIVLTPHLGYVTEEGFRNHYGQMVEGIDAWFKASRCEDWRRPHHLTTLRSPNAAQRASGALRIRGPI